MIAAKGQTTSSVHSREAMQAQRQGEGVHNHFLLSGMHLYAQVVIGLAFVVYRQVSTPGYMSVLLTALPLMGIYFFSCRLAGQPGLMESRAGRWTRLFLFAVLFCDAQLSLYAFVEIVREILPDTNSAIIALVTVLFVLPSLQKQSSHALPSLSRLLCWPMLAGLVFALAGGAARGNAGHLFPLFGRQPVRILSGAFWLLSALSAGLTPLYIRWQPITRQQQRQGSYLLLLALLLGAATAFVSALMMPFYFLARPDTPGAQLLLALKVNTGLGAWSVMVWVMLMLMLVSLACALSRCRHMLSQAVGKPVGMGLAFLLVPLPALSTDMAHELIQTAAPFRIVWMALALGLLGAAALGGRRKTKG